MFLAEGSTANINIVVKPRDSNDVLQSPESDKNTNDLWGKHHTYGSVTDSSYSWLSNSVGQDNLHMRFNQVDEEEEVEKTTENNIRPYWKAEFEDGDNNHLRFNEINEKQDEDLKLWTKSSDYDNGINWGPYNDNNLDYPNNQAKVHFIKLLRSCVFVPVFLLINKILSLVWKLI